MTSPTPSNAPPPKPWRGVLPRVLVSLLIAGGFVWLLLKGGLPLLPDHAALARLSGATLCSYFGLWMLVGFLRCYRWNYLLRPLDPSASRARVLGIGMVGFGAVFFAPLRSGEIVRPYLLSQDRGVTFMQAAGVVGAERVLDGLTMAIITFVSLSLSTPISPLPDHLGDLPLPVSAVPAAVLGAFLTFVAAFGLMLAFYFARDAARRLTERTLGIFSKELASWAARSLQRVADGLSFLPSAKNLLPFLRETLCMWSLTIAAQWILLRGLGLSVSPLQAAATVGVQGLGSIVPAGPGLFGAFQISSFSALALFVPLSNVRLEGAGFVFISYCGLLAVNTLQLLVGSALMAWVPPRTQA